MGKSPVELSYYVEKKLKRPLMLHGFISEFSFTKMLAQHGLVRELDHTLEKFEREGWLQPAFRRHREIAPPGQGRLVDPYMQQQHYLNGEIEFPRKGDYKPWSSFKPKSYEAGQKCTDVYYHKYQLLQVQNILEHKTGQMLCRNPMRPSDKEIKNCIMYRTGINMGSFESSYEYVTKIAGVMMLLEERYVKPATIFLHRNNPQINKLFQDMWDGYSADDMLRDMDISIEDVHDIRDSMREHAEYVDPVPGWYDLVRIMRHDVLKKIRGPVRTAQFYYNIARILTVFINDLEDNDGPDTPFEAGHVNYRERLYGVSKLDYNEQEVRKAIIEYYTQGPTARLYLLVEGDSEENVIKEIVKRNKLPFFNDYVAIINCGGVANMARKKIRHYVQTAHRDSSSVYLIADNEKTWGKHLQFARDMLGQKFRYTIWKTSFEEDNFGRHNVIRFINMRLRKTVKHSITDEEIRERQQNKAGLVNAMAKVYKDKYGEAERHDLYKAIGVSKSDLVLELLDDAYKRGTQDELEIVKIIRERLEMQRIWPV